MPESDVTMDVDPILEPGAEAPGCFAPDERGMNVWQGEMAWRTRHGPAMAHWLLGKPTRVEGATTADGPADIETASPMDHETWRRPDPRRPGAWIWGTAEFGPDGVTFSDRIQPAFEPYAQQDAPSLPFDLSRDREFLSQIQEQDFAHAVYDSLCNLPYRKRGERSRWACSWRYAGGLVANLRHRGETYIDFYLKEMLVDGKPTGREARKAVYEQVLEAYARNGWYAIPPEEAEADREDALRFLDEVEAQPAKPGTEWAEGIPDVAPPAPYGRAVVAAKTGRISKAQFREVSDNLQGKAWVKETDFVEILGGFEAIARFRDMAAAPREGGG